MKIYIVETTSYHVLDHAKAGAQRYLVSYWYDKNTNIIDAIHKLATDPDIILDSGAFTAHLRRKPIKLEEYIDFCLKNQDKVNHIASLDVIRNPEKTLENYDKMLEAGLKVIPTFHAGSDYSYLKYYCQKADYVAIGGIVSLTFDPRRLFNYVENIIENIPKKIKIHVFGTTNMNLIMRFADRIESCDSSIVTQSTAKNKTVTYTGFPKICAGIPTRITPEQYRNLDEYIAYRVLQIEKDINEFQERKKQLA